jgi:CDP-diacylglycerol--glycerol-3-phosphate 3-phosphatidyltransferase
VAANRDALRQWSQLHDGYDVQRSRLVRSWLRLVHALAAPLSRWQVPPNAVTLAGVVAASATVCTSRPVSAALVVITSLCDGLDGAVAIQRGRSSAHGALIDHSADRVTDVLFALALCHAGAGAWIVAADVVMVLGYESSRSLARRRGRSEALVTVGERPVRVAVTAIGILVAPVLGAAAVAVLCLVALLQLQPWSRTPAGD